MTCSNIYIREVGQNREIITAGPASGVDEVPNEWLPSPEKVYMYHFDNYNAAVFIPVYNCDDEYKGTLTYILRNDSNGNPVNIIKAIADLTKGVWIASGFDTSDPNAAYGLNIPRRDTIFCIGDIEDTYPIVNAPWIYVVKTLFTIYSYKATNGLYWPTSLTLPGTTQPNTYTIVDLPTVEPNSAASDTAIQLYTHLDGTMDIHVVITRGDGQQKLYSKLGMSASDATALLTLLSTSASIKPRSNHPHYQQMYGSSYPAHQVYANNTLALYVENPTDNAWDHLEASFVNRKGTMGGVYKYGYNATRRTIGDLSGIAFVLVPAEDAPTGAWECPGNGSAAVWVGGGTPTGTPPNCTGSYSCPGNGGAAIWSGSVGPYGTIPDCTGSYSCPGDGADATWTGTVPAYGSIPNCTGSYSCPGDGVDAVWSGEVSPYGPVPNCTGEWICPEDGIDAGWSNPDVPPYGSGPVMELTELTFTEYLDGDSVVSSDWINGVRRDNTINRLHAPALDLTGCTLSIAREYDSHAEVSCAVLGIVFPEDMVVTNLALEYSDDSTDGLDGTWTRVGTRDTEDDVIPRHVQNTVLMCMDPTDCESPIEPCVCEDLVLPSIPTSTYESPIIVAMDNSNECEISVVVNTSSLPDDAGVDIGSAVVTTANGIATITATLLKENANTWLHFYCDETYIGYRNTILISPCEDISLPSITNPLPEHPYVFTIDNATEEPLTVIMAGNPHSSQSTRGTATVTTTAGVSTVTLTLNESSYGLTTFIKLICGEDTIDTKVTRYTPPDPCLTIVIEDIGYTMESNPYTFTVDNPDGATITAFVSLSDNQVTPAGGTAIVSTVGAVTSVEVTVDQPNFTRHLHIFCNGNSAHVQAINWVVEPVEPSYVLDDIPAYWPLILNNAGNNHNVGTIADNLYAKIFPTDTNGDTIRTEITQSHGLTTYVSTTLNGSPDVALAQGGISGIGFPDTKYRARYYSPIKDTDVYIHLVNDSDEIIDHKRVRFIEPCESMEFSEVPDEFSGSVTFAVTFPYWGQVEGHRRPIDVLSGADARGTRDDGQVIGLEKTVSFNGEQGIVTFSNTLGHDLGEDTVFTFSFGCPKDWNITDGNTRPTFDITYKATCLPSTLSLGSGVPDIDGHLMVRMTDLTALSTEIILTSNEITVDGDGIFDPDVIMVLQTANKILDGADILFPVNFSGLGTGEIWMSLVCYGANEVITSRVIDMADYPDMPESATGCTQIFDAFNDIPLVQDPDNELILPYNHYRVFNDSGHPLKWTIQRGVDGLFYESNTTTPPPGGEYQIITVTPSDYLIDWDVDRELTLYCSGSAQSIMVRFNVADHPLGHPNS